MKWKEFLKPDRRKIMMSILIGIFGAFGFMLILVEGGICGIICGLIGCKLYTTCPFVGNIYASLYVPLSYIIGKLPFNLDLLSNFVYWYLLSCLIVWIHEKVKK